MNSKLKYSLVTAACLITSFFIVDCAGGKTQHLEAYVVAHEYKAQWLEMQVHTVDGITSTTVINHPEEFHLVCQIFSGSLMDVQTSKYTYEVTPDGRNVDISVRRGMWTGINYLPSIEQ